MSGHDPTHHDRPTDLPGAHEPAPGVDTALETLVHLVNSIDGVIELPLTVHLPGLVVSGLLISGHAHFTQLADTMRAQAPTSSGAPLLHALADLYEVYAHDYSQRRHPQTHHVSNHYLHLRDAHTITGASHPHHTPGTAAGFVDTGGVGWSGR